MKTFQSIIQKFLKMAYIHTRTKVLVRKGTQTQKATIRHTKTKIIFKEDFVKEKPLNHFQM